MRYLWYNHKKVSIICLAILVVGFLGFFLFNVLVDTTSPALALERDISKPNLRGWAWAETIGWISLNCDNTNTCGTVNYGVYYDGSSFKGSAWSENIGWIDFANATYNESLDEMRGIALFQALDESGVNSDDSIYLEDDNTGVSPDYGVSFTQSAVLSTLRTSGFARTSVVSGSYDNWGDALGWAWNGGNSTNKKGLGWLSFNCLDNSSCGSVDYKVTGKPSNINIVVTRTPGNEDTSLTVKWNSNILGVESFEVWRRKSAPAPIELNFGHKTTANKNSVNYIDGNPALDWYNEYEYLVMACNIFGCNLSNMYTKRTSPFRFDNGADLKVSGVCYDDNAINTSYVDLEWGPGRIANNWSGTPDHYDVEYCKLEQGENINDCNNTDWNNIIPVNTNCLNYVSNANVSCRDVLSQANGRYGDRYNLHAYRVRLVAAQKICELDSNTNCNNDSDCTSGSLGSCIEEVSGWLESGRLVRPCPKRTQPDYIEVRPKS